MLLVIHSNTLTLKFNIHHPHELFPPNRFEIHLYSFAFAYFCEIVM